MKLDDLLNKAPILEPPDSLKTKVMESIGKKFDLSEDTPSRAGYFFTKRTVLSFAAMAAALLFAFRIFPDTFIGEEPQQVASVTQTQKAVEDDRINEFVEEALSQVFGAEPGMEIAYDDEPIDFDTYISNQIEEIFWINGGNNA